MPKRKNPEPIYPVLEAEIAKRGILKRTIAEGIGIIPRTLSSKLTGGRDFSLREAIAIQENFFSDMDIKVLFERS